MELHAVLGKVWKGTEIVGHGVAFAPLLPRFMVADDRKDPRRGCGAQRSGKLVPDLLPVAVIASPPYEIAGIDGKTCQLVQLAFNLEVGRIADLVKDQVLFFTVVLGGTRVAEDDEGIPPCWSRLTAGGEMR